MRTAEYRLSQVRVGLFVAISGVVLTASILYFGVVGSPFSRSAHIRAEFDNIYGLAEGSPVEMGGVGIGQIEQIELPDLKTGLIPVTLSVRRDALSRLGPSSLAFASSHALVGQRFIGLTVRQEGEAALQDGAAIKTKPSDALDTVMAQAQKTLEQVNALVADARQITGVLARVAAEIDAGHGTLGRLVHEDALYSSLSATAANAQQITDQMAHGKGALPTLVNDPRLGQQLRSSVEALAQTAENVKAGKGLLGRLTNDEVEAKRLDRTLANVDAVASRLADAKGTLGALISDPALLEKVNELIGQMDSLVADMRRNPQRYLKISAF
jgi:phospholipid/cholesterol/gamma-HCH transport system substrate-binding protein